jgi:hypothetical protein
MKKEIVKLAKLLRTSEEVVLDLEKKMEKISGRKGIVEKIVQDNDRQVERVLKEFGLANQDKLIAERVYQALINKIKKDDQALFEHFSQPDFSTALGCRSLIDETKELTNHLKGFYLKEAKARELLKLNPPKKIMADLGYGDDIDKMLAQEDVFEIFCALRFVEDSLWLNDVFFKPYRDLTRDDFEQREIKVMVLPERWTGIGQKFLGKKLHHMSHLKELGIVFVIPVTKQAVGETLYLFFMTLHYTYETDWHSRLFEKYSREENFAQKMIQALKVEVTGQPLPDEKKISWRIVAKYLAKDDPNDPRLAEPHISPEAWHYTKAALAINKFARQFPEIGLTFWQGLDVVGDYFPVNNSKEENLISFDLFDNGISLLRQMGFESKYLYHQQEALWNEVFINYLGQEKLDKMMMENLDKGYVSL